MDTQLLAWLHDVGTLAFRASAALFVGINVAFAAVLAARRDRAVVQRWTAPWLAANLVLLGTGLGIPALTALARLVISVLVGPGNAVVGSPD
jgi:hypothetical protein